MSMQQFMIWHQYLWPEWQIVNEIGSGAYGTVYKIRREDESGVYFAALKVIIISVGDELITVSSQCKEETKRGEKTKRSSFAEEVSKEISFMEKFKGNSNIVSYEDHRIIFDEESKSWIVLLRMELLTPLAEYYRKGERTEMDVVRLGIDICNALAMCEKEAILHRDVKPGNIFVSEFGNYKLGDFGIAFITHHTQTMREPIGTHDYMAPEVVRGKIYNKTVDLYSLGLIMYRILNGGRAPFLSVSEVGETVTGQKFKQADARRLNGEPLPKLKDTSDALCKIVLKACSYEPRERYQSASEFGDSLKEYEQRLETEERIRKKASMNRYFSAAGELD